MKQLFKCNDSRELVEYIENKVQLDQTKGLVQLTQPVLIQSFQDEFGAHDDRNWETPTLTGQILVKGEENEQLSLNDHKNTRQE